MNKELIYMLFEIDFAKRIEFNTSTTDYEKSVELRKYGLVVIRTTKQHDRVCVTLSNIGNEFLLKLVNFGGELINERYGY